MTTFLRHRYLLAVLASASALTFACGDSPSATEGGSSGGTPDASSKDSGNDAGDDATSDGSLNRDGGADADAGDAAYQPPDSLCDPQLQLNDPTVLASSTPLDDNLGTVTPDELTIAWTTTDAGTTTVLYADRAGANDAFGATKQFAGDFADDRAALSDDGLTLLLVHSDRRSFLLFARASRDEAFAPADASTMEPLTIGLGADARLADPVFARGAYLLVYSVYGGGAIDTVQLATRLSATSPFSVGGPLAFPELRASGNKRRRPTGIDVEFQTLFFYDEISNTEKIGLLKGTIGFFSVHDLGQRPGAQPNASCSRVYYSVPKTSLDLAVATPK